MWEKSNANNPEAQIKPDSEICKSITNIQEITDLIHNVYSKFVFAIDSNNEDSPVDYFTDNALEKLHSDYEYDCENESCYAYYALRTNEQDSKPGSKEESKICGIEPIADGWYVISYLDMGWPGMTRVKIVDGKIDDYIRCVSN